MFSTQKPFVSSRFRREVLLHAVKNFQSENRFVPLILGIHGPSGEGKSFQCEYILKENGIEPFYISGGQLESPNAGHPAQVIRREYLRAGKAIKDKKCVAAALIINDIDAGIGDWGGLVQTTINTQNVYAELMNLVDNPTSVESIPTKRIPIFVTGNDFTKLYEPLVRAGRMSAFEWIPNEEERVQMISGIFPEIEEKKIEEFYTKLKVNFGKNEPPIAFYSHLKTMLFDDMIWDTVKKNPKEAIKRIANGGKFKFVTIKKLKLNIDTLVEAGLELLQTGKFINHLKN